MRIKQSDIPNAGKGLFAWKKPFRSNQKISNYTGRKLPRKELDHKYGPGGAEYALCSCDKCVDANVTMDAAARFANDSSFTNNSELHSKD